MTNQPQRYSSAFHNQDGRPVGDFDGRWLCKRVNRERHAFRQAGGCWASDVCHLAAIERLGGLGVHLVDETGRHWFATVAAFRRFGFVQDHGFGRQTFLPFARWRDVEMEALDALKAVEDETVQLQLFEETRQ